MSMIYYKLNSFLKKKMFIRSIKDNILAEIFEDYVWAVDLDCSSIVLNIKLVVCDVKIKKNYYCSFHIDLFIILALKKWPKMSCGFEPHITLDLYPFSIVNNFWWLLYGNLFLKCPTASNSEYLYTARQK